ncbi:hypothetical protein FRX31_016542 [Thalictrum thalictroides]|uniref:Uncharacterized protein n=1 Tax=Thalictrum thalictroides TaxID=46969 RepID=A0A7J6W995_THATH|nr:hypothetical protein FRX31_016542 [Thalictrum thalictroides]
MKNTAMHDSGGKRISNPTQIRGPGSSINLGERRNSLDIQDQGGNRNSSSIQIPTSKGLHGSTLEESNPKGNPTPNADLGYDEEEIAIIEAEVIKKFGEGSLEKLRRKRSIFSNQDSTAEKPLLEAETNGKKLGLPTEVETCSTQSDEAELNRSKEDQVTTNGSISHEDHGAGKINSWAGVLGRKATRLEKSKLHVNITGDPPQCQHCKVFGHSDAKCIHKPVKPVKKVATWVEKEHDKVENDHTQKQQPLLIEESNTEVSTKEHGEHAEPQQGLNGDEHEWQSPTKHKARRHSNEGTGKATGKQQGGSSQGRFEALKGLEVSDTISLTTKERLHHISDTLSLTTKQGYMTG